MSLSLSPSSVEAHTLGARWLAQRAADPLSHFRFAVPRLKDAFGLFSLNGNAKDEHGYRGPIDELHARAGNKGGKTLTAAAYVLACMQKRSFLDGVRLPWWHGRVEALCGVLDYKQQLLSVQPAYLRLLGSWPHKAKYTGEYLASLYVRPTEWNSDDHTTWSVMHFLSQENKRSGIGARADIVHFDEPPVMAILRELRKAGHSGRRSLIVISETPEHRREWAPLREDYGDCPRDTIQRVDEERAEVRWNLLELPDWIYPAHEKAKIVRKYKGDVLYGDDGGARVFGDYMNTEGACPFDIEVLTQMLAECTGPKINSWSVPRETTDGVARNESINFEVWRAPKSGRRYRLDIDPASGVNDGGHNPAELQISEEDSGDLCARWNGYLSPYSVGVLAAGLALQYNRALVDVETNDNFGVTVVKGLWACRYGNIAHEVKPLEPGKISQTVGWRATEATRADIIGSTQRWIDDYRAGVKYAVCPSAAVIHSIINTELDARGKIVAIQGIDHGEGMVLNGRKLSRLRRPNREMRGPEAPIPHPDAALIQRIRGGGSDDVDDSPLGWKARP